MRLQKKKSANKVKKSEQQINFVTFFFAIYILITAKMLGIWVNRCQWYQVRYAKYCQIAWWYKAKNFCVCYQNCLAPCNLKIRIYMSIIQRKNACDAKIQKCVTIFVLIIWYQFVRKILTYKNHSVIGLWIKSYLKFIALDSFFFYCKQGILGKFLLSPVTRHLSSINIYYWDFEIPSQEPCGSHIPNFSSRTSIEINPKS